MKFVNTYNQYLNSAHWQQLRYRHITNNKRAKCFVTGKKTHLVLHHASYQNKYNEQLNRDVYILNDRIHHHVHYVFFGLVKLPLNTTLLLKRMYWLRLVNSAKNGNTIDSVYCLKKLLLG